MTEPTASKHRRAAGPRSGASAEANGITCGELYSEIHAGGSGTRLWPLSRAGHPKFLHALTGSPSSLLQATMARVTPLTPPERTFVVTGAAHAAAVARQLPSLPEENLLVEPSPRDSCPAIGLAAVVIARRDPLAVMGSYAADHLIRDQAGFEQAIRAAVVGAREGKLMTVGITPTHPETGYGYLQCAGATGDIRTVVEFKEKPPAEVAEAYVASGRYLWNAGMFIWRVDTFLSELERQQPAMFEGLTLIAQAWGTPEQDRVLGEVWPLLPKISVDHAVMEGAAAVGRVATVPGTFGWTDVGDFDTLATVLAGPDGLGADGMGNVVVNDASEAPVLMLETTNSVVVSHAQRLVAMLGVEDVIVVDTPDAVLVCGRDRAQKLKSVVDEIKSRGDGGYL
jgi:mannose-1-phosphate guanylyltransferase